MDFTFKRIDREWSDAIEWGNGFAELCAKELEKWFDIPADCNTVTISITKSKRNKESVYVEPADGGDISLLKRDGSLEDQYIRIDVWNLIGRLRTSAWVSVYYKDK